MTSGQPAATPASTTLGAPTAPPVVAFSPAPIDEEPEGPPVVRLVVLGMIVGATLLMGTLSFYDNSGVSAVDNVEPAPALKGRKGKRAPAAN